MESTTIRYEFVNGEFTDVEVSNELAQTIRESRREEHNLNERNRYHTAFSLDAGEYEAANLVCDKKPEDILLDLENNQHLLECMARLSKIQRERLLMLADGMTITEIACLQGVDRTSVKESIEAARKKSKSFFEKHPPFCPSFSVNSERTLIRDFSDLEN